MNIWWHDNSADTFFPKKNYNTLRFPIEKKFITLNYASTCIKWPARKIKINNINQFQKNLYKFEDDIEIGINSSDVPAGETTLQSSTNINARLNNHLELSHETKHQFHRVPYFEPPPNMLINVYQRNII